ncbi:MAG: hypothetical protein TECD_00619 [Hyphomicrobiaceae bacterium hypho_1]
MAEFNNNIYIGSLSIKQVTFGDLRDVFRLGVRDFLEAPKFGLLFGAIYSFGGLLISFFVLHLGVYWMLYPFVIGFLLIGPYIAAGLYDVSRRREQGLVLKWSEVLGVVWLQRRREFAWMAFVVLFVFWLWIYKARTLVAIFFGFQGFATFNGFLESATTTTNGWLFLLVGHGIGAVLASILFCLTVTSFPLLLDRDVDFITAMLTSIRVVLNSPKVMFAWGAFVIAAILISMIPAFIGLLVTLPILGHATWHLYKRAIS